MDWMQIVSQLYMDLIPSWIFPPSSVCFAMKALRCLVLHKVLYSDKEWEEHSGPSTLKEEGMKVDRALKEREYL